MTPSLVFGLIALVGAAFAVVGLLLIRNAVRTGRSSAGFERRAQPAEAEVTELRHRWTGGGAASGDIGSRWLVTVVRFALPDGRVVEAEARPWTKRKHADVGQRLAVRYDPENPMAVAVAGRGTGAGVGGCAFLVMGAGFLVLGSGFAALGVALLVGTR